MQNRAVRIISNFKDLAQAITPGESLTHEFIGDSHGLSGALRFIRSCWHADLLILDDDQQKLLLACLLRPLLRFRLVSVDLILRRPRTLKGQLGRLFKKILFSQVDRFILYFKEISGYEHLYGIKSDRAVYVPFKVNGWEQTALWPLSDADGDYVLCAGRTLRDVRTFVEAMRKIDCPALLLQQQPELLSQHGTSPWSGGLPVNVQLLVDASDGLESFVDFINRARVVVIPRFRHDIAATGISTYLVAMALRKCVIISEGPGAGDVLTDQAVIVPPEDVERLAQQIELLWNDEGLRQRIAAQGRLYAEQLGGEKRFLSDILRASINGLRR
jgi:glycosyltransferase involved in cell wall biosynthesis